MGRLSSMLDNMATDYLKGEMGISEDSVSQRIEKQKYCPSCGKGIELNATVCYNCGVNPQKVNHKKYCPYCGNSVNEEQVICLNCRENIENTVIDNANAGIRILCFLIPLVGLIVYLANINTRKEYAKDCGSSALCGFCIGIVLAFILGMVLFAQ